MTEEENELETEVEQNSAKESPQERTVPLAALEAERRKRQDLEAQNRVLQDAMIKANAPVDDPEDEDEFITKSEMKRRLNEATTINKREVMEEAFCSAKPEALDLINLHLEAIIKRKPWLAQSIDSAPNRYARAYEIVQDYMPSEQPRQQAKKYADPQGDAKRIVDNANKPGNPGTVAKPVNMNQADYLRSIAGKPEFKEYRKKMLAGG